MNAKALILSALGISIVTVSMGQQSWKGKFSLSGNLAAYSTIPTQVAVTIIKPGGGYIFDSAIVQNNTFSFQREIEEPMVMLLSVKSKPLPGETPGRGQRGTFDYISVFAVPSENKLVLSDSLLASAHISGPAATYTSEYQQLINRFDAFNKQARALTAKEGEKTKLSEERTTAINDSLGLIADKEYRNFVMQHPASPVAINALLSYASRPVWTPRKNLQPDSIQMLMNLLPRSSRKLPALEALQQNLNVAKQTAKGKPALNFSLPDTTGKIVSLSDFKGKYVFLDFWASWCAPCRKENPVVKRMFEQYKEKGFTVVSVSLDRPGAKQAWIDAIAKDQLSNWTHLSDLKGFDSNAATLYYIKSIPANFLIAPNGLILDRNLYGKALEQKLRQTFETTGN